jgi:hypothetical protein
MARYRTWGLDTDRGVGWWTRALCHGRTRMFFTADAYVAAQAAHLCTHCPVLQSCRREAQRLTPVGAVQAGVWYPCPTVRLLAQPYADRPGYRDEWRP